MGCAFSNHLDVRNGGRLARRKVGGFRSQKNLEEIDEEIRPKFQTMIVMTRITNGRPIRWILSRYIDDANTKELASFYVDGFGSDAAGNIS